MVRWGGVVCQGIVERYCGEVWRWLRIPSVNWLSADQESIPPPPLHQPTLLYNHRRTTVHSDQPYHSTAHSNARYIIIVIYYNQRHTSLHRTPQHTFTLPAAYTAEVHP